MAAHENLAGGLIGGGGALFAAWLVGSVVREQVQDERKRDKEAKRSTLEWKVNDKEQDVAALKAYSERLNKVDEAFRSSRRRPEKNRAARAPRSIDKGAIITGLVGCMYPELGEFIQ